MNRFGPSPLLPLLCTVVAACSPPAQPIPDAEVVVVDAGPPDSGRADAGSAVEARPFGLFPANGFQLSDPYQAAREAGVVWMRGTSGQPTLFWSMVDPQRTGDSGRMAFSGTTTGANGEQVSFDYDQGIAAAAAAGMNLMMNLDVAPSPWSDYRVHGSWLPTDEGAYQRFVETAVRRYPKVRVWQVGNEPNADTTPQAAGLGDAGLSMRELANFGRLQRLTYEAAKRADPTVLVVLAGTVELFPNVRDDYYDKLLDEVGCCVDVFDFHLYGDPVGGSLPPPPNPRMTGYQDIETAAADFRQRLNQRGMSRTRIWLSETGAPTGTFKQGPLMLTATEAQQGRDLPKRYVTALASGIEKIFWYSLLDGFGTWEDKYFDHVGLLYDGHGAPLGTPKLGFWAYWQMTRQLEGCQWGELKALPTTVAQTRAYRCPLSQGGEVIIAWWDTFLVPGWSPGRTTQLEVPWSGTTAVIRAAIPSAARGADVPPQAPQSAFASSTAAASGGRITLTLGADPVYVRPQ